MGSMLPYMAYMDPMGNDIEVSCSFSLKPILGNDGICDGKYGHLVLRTLEQRHLVFFVWTNCAALATFKIRNRTSTGLDIHGLVLGEHFAGHPLFLLPQTRLIEQVFAGNLVLMCELMYISEITDLRC